MTTIDGDWLAIYSTNKDRTVGFVQCYPGRPPTDGPSELVFMGISAAFVQVEDRHGAKSPAIATLILGSDGGNGYLEMQIFHLDPSSSPTEPKRYPNESVGKPLPRLWYDPDHSLLVAVVGTSAFIFDSNTGDLLRKDPIITHHGQSAYCGAGGLYVETEGRTLQKLRLRTGGLAVVTAQAYPEMPSAVRTPSSGLVATPSTPGFSSSSSWHEQAGTDGIGEGVKKSRWRVLSGFVLRKPQTSEPVPSGKKTIRRCTSTASSAYHSLGMKPDYDESWIYADRVNK